MCAATLVLVNGPPGVGKSTIARRLRDDRPLSLLVDFDELWPLIGDWEHGDNTQQLAIDAGLAMARAHLQADHDVIAAQFAVAPEFLAVLDSLVADASAVFREIVLTGDPDRVATQFRQRRAERAKAGEHDVSSNIPDDHVDAVIARAIDGLAALAAARPQTIVVPSDGDTDVTYQRVREALHQRA
jgi:broad-specificity NMP kinase